MKTLRRAGVATAAVTFAAGGLLVQSTAPASAAPRAVGVTSAAAVAATSPFGTSINSLDDVGRVSTLLGRPLSSVRVFLSNTPSTWAKNQLLATIPANGTVSLSFDSVNPGTATQIATFLSGKPSTMKCYATYFHEPEDNFTTATQKAAYLASWHTYAPVFRAAGCTPTLILMKWSLNPKSGRNWHDWYPQGDVDVLGFDAYNTRAKVGGYGIPADYLAPILAASTETGLPWALTELGSDIPAGTSPSERAAWAHGVAVAATADPRFLFADWWDVLSTTGRDYTLDSATALAWNNGPATAPLAPGAVSVTAGPASASASWSPPSDGGSPITGYTIAAANTSNGTVTTAPAGSGATSGTVSGLANGLTYQVSVTATNTVGTGPASAVQLVVPGTVATIPDAPTVGTATPGNTSATITFTAPVSNGGATITGYQITALNTASGTTTGMPVAASATSGTVPGLSNGQHYTLSVAATNSLGNSPASDPSNVVTPAALAGAPTIGRATAGNASLTVSWTAPGSDGGSPVTGYRITAVNAYNQPVSSSVISAPATSGTVGGLTNGHSAAAKVTAINAVGDSASSAMSNTVTPMTVPDAPALGGSTGGVKTDTVVSATAYWILPSSNGGSPITGYRVIADQYVGTTLLKSTSSALQSATLRKLQFTGLTLAATYRFRVCAVNMMGDSVYAGPSNMVSAY